MLVRKLTVAQALYVAGTTVDLTLTGIVGARLAPTPALATLPYASIFLAAGLSTGWISRALTHYLPRQVFAVTGLSAAIAGLISAFGVQHSSFWIFCVGTALVGIYTAGAGYYRYLAAEAEPETRARAVSRVLAGGLVAAIVGPFLATSLRDLTSTPFVGSYLLVALLGVAATLWNWKLPDAVVEKEGRAEGGAGLQETAASRSLRALWSQPRLWVGLAAAILAASTMLTMMTAGPILGEYIGYTAGATAFAIQLHMVGMYAPGLFVSRAIGRIGEARVALAGAVLIAFAGIAAASGTSLGSFFGAMLLVGVGWNLAYTGGSALITTAYEPHERARVQTIAEVTIVVAQVSGALLAATLTTASQWPKLGWTCIVLGFAVAAVCLTAIKKP